MGENSTIKDYKKLYNNGKINSFKTFSNIKLLLENAH